MNALSNKELEYLDNIQELEQKRRQLILCIEQRDILEDYIRHRYRANYGDLDNLDRWNRTIAGLEADIEYLEDEIRRYRQGRFKGGYIRRKTIKRKPLKRRITKHK